jgi:drug/metabolite transporter (DMT)-like permease
VRGSDVLRLVALAAIWGSSFVFMRTLAPVLGPVLTAATRVAVAGFALVAWLGIAGIDAEMRARWRQYATIGVVNSAVPFLLFSFAALHLPASYLAILNSAAPMFAAVFSAAFLGERMSRAKGSGLAAGAAGVALVSGAGPVAPDAAVTWSIAASLGAAACYAAAGVYMKRFASGAKPVAVAAWSQVAAAVALAPLVPFAPLRGQVTPSVVGNVLALALLCSAAAYLLYYRLIVFAGPTRAMTVTFLIPLFGMAWGALFLGESVTPTMLAGCALIVGGTVAVVRATNADRGRARPGSEIRA